MGRGGVQGISPGTPKILEASENAAGKGEKKEKRAPASLTGKAIGLHAEAVVATRWDSAGFWVRDIRECSYETGVAAR